MADPISLTAYAALATAAAGTGLSAISNIQQAHAASANANYQAQVAANNALTAEQNREAAIRAGETKATIEGAQQRARMGALMAGEAASGVDVNSGSPVDIRASQRQTGVFDTQDTYHNALMQAYGYQTQGTGFQAQSGLYKAEGKQASSLAPLTAASSLVQGASSLAGKWSQFKTSGALGSGT